MSTWEFVRFLWRHKGIAAGGFSARRGMRGDGLPPGSPVPALFARSATGAPVPLATLGSGRPVVLNFGSCS